MSVIVISGGLFNISDARETIVVASRNHVHATLSMIEIAKAWDLVCWLIGGIRDSSSIAPCQAMRFSQDGLAGCMPPRRVTCRQGTKV